MNETRYTEAAAEYDRLAGLAGGSDAIEFRLAGADALRQAGDFAGTDAMLARIDPKTITPEQNARATLIRARVALDSDARDQALALTNTLEGQRLPTDVVAEATKIRAEVHAAGRDFIAAARERVDLELLLTEQDEITVNRRELWLGLQQVSVPELSAGSGSAPDTLSGWLELTLLAKQYLGDQGVFDTQLQSWTDRYPGHPATDGITSELLTEAEQVAKGFQHIAVVLPFSGPFAEAAEAIRDGFTAAWFLDNNPTKALVSVFDSTDRDPKEVIAEALANGVDVVVGPLKKESVGRIEGWPERPLPVLALNRSPGTTVQAVELQADASAVSGSRFYQFTLSPEDEARRVAERAWADGLVQAAVLTPDSGWGERVAQAFSDSWLALGGVVVDSQVYSREVQEMAAPVKALLNVAASEQRRSRLQSVLKTQVKHESRRRQDVDFIFLAAFPQTARSLKPQIDFFRGSDLPIYATSHIFTGFPDPAADQDIERVIFGDMPWVLEDRADARALRDQLSAAWAQSSSGFTRFYAFGADAYQLVPNIARLAANPDEEIAGFTGWLSVEPGNTVKRRLVWAQIRKGYPEIIDQAR